MGGDILVYASEGHPEEVHPCSPRHVQKERDSGEVCVGNNRSIQGGSGTCQGSALSPFLFAIVMDTVTDNIRKEAPWSMMFADDVVLCCEEKSELEEDLGRWRDRLEKRGVTV